MIMKTFAFCFLLVLTCFANPISAQSDSLITELEKTLQAQIDTLGAKHLDIAMYCDSLGTMYIEAGNFAQADTLFTKALDIKAKKLKKDHPHIANSYYNLGKVYRFTGNYAQAIFFHKKALNIRLGVLGETHIDVSNSYNDLGITYYRTGDYKKAISLLNQALNIKLGILGENHTFTANAYNNLGLVYKGTGDYKKGISLLKKALNIRLEIFHGKHLDLAVSYNNLGNAFCETGDYEKAINFYHKTLNIKLDVLGENHPKVALSYNNLGNAYVYIGDYEKGISFHHKALNIRLEVFGEKHPEIAVSYGNLGVVHGQIGDYEKAIGFHHKALNIRLEVFGEKHANIAESYNDLGVAHGLTGDYKKAISLLNQALNIRLEVFDEKTPEIALNYNDLGVMHELTGDYEKAIDFHHKALNIRLEVFDGQHPNVTKSYNNLAVTYEEIDNYKTADSLWHIAIPQSIERLKSTYLFLPNDRRIKYSNTLTSTNTDFYSFAAIHGTASTKQLATNFLLNNKSLALDYAVSTSQLIKEIKDTALISQYEQLNKLQKQLADAETLSIEERQEKGWNLSKIQKEQEVLAFQILQHPQLKSRLNTKIIEWKDVQNHLLVDEAVLDFIEVYEKKDSLWAYYAVVISKDFSSPQFVRISDEKTLAKPLKTDEEKRPDYLYDRKSRKALYKVLWQPLEPYLEGVKTVHISPSGILHRVPFESLQNTDNEFLAAKYQFHYYSAIRDILKEKSQKNTYEDMVLMGHILYDLDHKDKYEAEENIAFRGENRNIRNGIKPLPGTLEEVMQIDNIGKGVQLKTTLLMIDAASEDTVQYFVREYAPSIFHIATHGVFLPPLEKENLGQLTGRDRLSAADNPLQRSALMLYGANEAWTKGRRILGSGEDGILTALEVTALDLQNTELVVLSACSTGLGNLHNTEGVFGLQRAFKLAGVNYVVASLWNIDDTATKELMVAFYVNLLQKKQAPATALSKAKDELREAGYEPHDWAGFILIE